ncbi:replicative primase/helicase [Xanthomonas phage XAJ2]|uniref:Replicative primase/helicase n=1 Tax=Xanthomonas phage XAJ2 TaxID=1775249 RepID=A0A1I9L2G8_9CAUD|nr:replicative primase/helicase [Xanthomonas phage XAJ2]
MFERIPQELREWPQWVCWRLEDTDAPKPTKVPYNPRTGGGAMPNNSDTWGTYEQAISTFNHGGYSGIGFMLSNADPYAFIDLDDPYELKPDGSYKHENPKEVFERQMEVFTKFDSFAELSPSGKGLHLIVKGNVEAGRRRSSIEVYSSHRFMTMTGNVYRDAPIRDHNTLLQILWGQLGATKNLAVAHYTGLADATESDEKIIQRAQEAENGDKFVSLYTGEWQGYYGSQSEADLALIDIIAFYTQNNKQIKRIFYSSALGQRDKAKRDDYMSYMLNKCFDRMMPPVDIDGLKNMLEQSIANSNKVGEANNSEVEYKPTPQPEYVSSPQPVAMEPTKSIYSPPPGLVGQLAQYIYQQAPRPVPEIALAGAIGLLAGIVGRAYNVSGTGLNQYVLLLAPTGTGKEAIARGVDKLMATIERSVPASKEFIGPAEISSHQALTKYMANTSKSFVSIVGEFGIQLKLMASPHAPPHLAGLMRMIMDLFNKSGEGNIMRPSIYSDREKNTTAILAPAFTWLGESTPEKFYDALDETMITSGLLPRFTTIEYYGKRPPLNPLHGLAQPSFDLIEKLGTVCSHALQLNANNRTIAVAFDEQAKKLFQDFDVFCDNSINSSEKEIRKQLWNRAHIKAMKLAALVAVGVNPYDPIITTELGNWAIDLIMADARNLIGKFDAGEIGVDNDESKQLTTVVSAVAEYMKSPYSQVEKYIPGQAALHGERIIPYSYIQRKLGGAAIFRKDKRGSSDALKRTLKTLQERGDLQEVSKAKLSTEYGTTALCFMIKVPRVFGL